MSAEVAQAKPQDDVSYLVPLDNHARNLDS